MRCLVVAHPLPASLSHCFAAHVRHELEAARHEVEVLDLYAAGFDPRLPAAERASYYADRHDVSAVEEHVAALTRAEALFLVFPTWWFGLPAILKGRVDRVFAPGVAFDHGADFGPVRPRLATLRHVVAVTTLGSPWWFDLFVMRRPLRRILKIAVTGACAPRARFRYAPFHAAEKPAAARLDAFEASLSRTIRAMR